MNALDMSLWTYWQTVFFILSIIVFYEFCAYVARLIINAIQDRWESWRRRKT